MNPRRSSGRWKVAILRQEAHHGPAPPGRSAAAMAEPALGVVTFMFTDLVGSTELLDRLGDDAADELRRRHFVIVAASAGGTRR